MLTVKSFQNQTIDDSLKVNSSENFNKHTAVIAENAAFPTTVVVKNVEVAVTAAVKDAIVDVRGETTAK